MSVLQPFRPFLRVGLGLVFGYALLNLVLSGLAATPVLGWLPERQTGTGFLLDNRQRVQAAEDEFRNGKFRDHRPLAAVVGISNVREGVNLDVLAAGTDRKWRFIGVAGAGAGTPSIAEQAQILLHSDLKPDLVIIGVMPIQMLDTLVVPSRAEALTAAAARPSLRDLIKTKLNEWAWTFARRKDVSLAFERALLELRMQIFEAIGANVATEDIRSPWRPMLRMMGAEQFPDKELKNGILWAESLGAFDLATYQGSNVGPQALSETIRQFTNRGARVLIIYTPEHSWLRRKIPASATKVLNSKLNRVASSHRMCPILDLRNSLPDSGFVDLVHPNNVGSKRLSHILAQRIGDDDFCKWHT